MSEETCPECGCILEEHGFDKYYCVWCNSMYDKEEGSEEKRLKINKPDFSNFDEKMKAHNKRMKDLKDSIKNLHKLPDIDKRPCMEG